jgi:hypothetical protein
MIVAVLFTDFGFMDLGMVTMTERWLSCAGAG